MAHPKQLLATFALALALALNVQAASVTASGYTNDFGLQPSGSDWSTVSMSGAGTTSSTAADLNNGVQAVTASSVNAALTADSGNPPGALATAAWNSAGQFVYTRPTGNNATLLMLTLQNNSGSPAGRITISYDYAEAAPFTEQIRAHLVYYSLSGAANSWTPIPELTSANPGRLTATVNLAWPSGGTLYILWADDNADGGTDPSGQIDNFSATVTSANQVPAAITAPPVNTQVVEMTAATFSATATGNPIPSFQWYRGGVAIPDATNSTYVLAEAPLSYDQNQFTAVAYNAVSNVNYSATSGVAVLTVTPDTNRPVLLDAFALGLTQVQVSFSEKLSAATATNTANYRLTNASGNVAISAATLDASMSNVVLVVGGLTAGANYTLRVSNVTDRAVAANAVAPGSFRTFAAYTYTVGNIGSPAPGGTATSVSGGFNLTGGGTNIDGTADQFSFFYQPRSGDFDVKVRVANLGQSDVWAKAGLMARENLNANTMFAAVLATPSIQGVVGNYRTTVGGAAATTGNYPVNYPFTWVRLKRAGSLFSFFAGTDGQNWTDLGSVTIVMSANINLGYAVSSAAANTAATAEFRDLGDATGGNLVPLSYTREPLGPCTRRGGLVITEIMYNPRELSGPSNSLEYVEIFNSNPYFEDISGFRLTGDIGYTFPSNTILPGGAFIVVAQYPDAVREYYQIANVFGPFVGSLPNDAGLVRLRNGGGAVMLEVNYSTQPPWPVAADGTGHSLVLARPSYGENDPRAWEASTFVDGSPGRMDPAITDPYSAVVINEFLANSEPPQQDFVEIFNAGATVVDISGAWLTDKRAILTDPTITNKFRIPDGTILQPRRAVVFYQSDLNFALAADGETIMLVNSNLNRILDMVPFEGQAMGVSSGRYPDGAPGFHALASQTPGTNNAPLLVHDVVINEIMFNPISGKDDDEYVELYNKGTNTIDLTRWRFTSGIDYRFPVGAQIPAGGYVVVAKNHTNLLARYPQLNAANTYGDFGGTLANGGERLALALPEYHLSTNFLGVVLTNIVYVLVDDVTWRDGGRWGTWTDGGGSSLELIDPRSDHRLAQNWADSDETGKAPWTNFVWTEVIDQIYPRTGSAGQVLNEVQAMILGKGEVLMDDVDVHLQSGPNVVANPGFASGLGGWLIQGNHVRSVLEPAGPNNPSQCMRIRATAGGDNGANRVECDLTTTLTVGATATIGAKLRWLRGYPDVLLRLHGGGLEAVCTLPVPTNCGTPGQPNSRARANNGPAISDITHFPVLPAAGTNVVVSARVHDPDGIGSVQLRYRSDPSATYTTVSMADNGTGGDVIAGDGVYSATILGQSAGVLICFYVQAGDAHASPATNTFPAVAPSSECQVRFGDPATPGSLGAYRIWMTAANINTWTSREGLSNEPLEGTFVYGNIRAIYLANARYRGSPFTRNAGSPTRVNAALNYVWGLPDDDVLLGTGELNLDSLEPGGSSNVRDVTALREQTSFTIAEQLGLPFSYQRFVHIVINGVTSASRNIPICTDSQQPNSDYVGMWFPEGNDGDLFKIDDWFEFDDTPSRQDNRSASLMVFNGSNGTKKKARYRWNWEKKVNKGLNDDYAAIYETVDAMNAPDSLYVSQVEKYMDIEEWLTALAVGHVVGDWDRYGYNRGKNQFVYRPLGGKINMLLWDLDFSLGCQGGNPPTQDLFTLAVSNDNSENHMPEMQRMYNHPYFRRIYYRALLRIAQGPLQDAAYGPKLDARYKALLANGVTGTTSPYVASGAAPTVSIPDWIKLRRTNILSVVPSANFAVATTNYLASSNNLVTLSGTAPVTVKNIRVNGQDYPVTWAGNYTGWSISFYATQATNALVIQAYDYQNAPIASMAATNIFVYTGVPQPARGTVVISEIMYRPSVTNAEYVELFNTATNYTFDLSNWRVNGLDFTFPLGAYILPQQAIVVVKDRAAFSAGFPAVAAANIAGVFSGNLSRNGETLTLYKPIDSDTEEVVDRVRYEASAPWAPAAANQGAALMLVDAAQDHSRPLNWSDGSGWQFASLTVSNRIMLPSQTNLTVQPRSTGVIYIDDLRIEETGSGSNLVVNGDFESPLAGTWVLGSYVLDSTISTEFKRSGNSSLKLVSSGRAISLAQSLAQPLTLQTGKFYTVSFWFLPSPTLSNVVVNATSYVLISTNTEARLVNNSVGVRNSAAVPLPNLPPVYLNEAQAENLTGAVDNFGEREPWVELYNGGTNAVNLDGLYLANNYTNLAQWAFPAGTVIDPGQFLVVWVDGQTNQTSGTNLHANFRLTATNGSVALVMPLGQEFGVLDYLNYTNLNANDTYGDYPDGQLFYRQKFGIATPAAANNPAQPMAAVTINEWMASNTRTIQEPNSLLFEDWFELYNSGDEAVDLTGYYLTDNPTGQPNAYEVPAGYTVPPHGYLLVWADNQPARNSTNSPVLHVNFQLSRTGEAIGLYTPDGRLVDSVTFEAQQSDVSQGRFPDGSAQTNFMTTPTPGASNVYGASATNHPPEISGLSNQVMVLGQTLSFTVSASDIDAGQTLTYALESNVAGNASLTGGGVFTWTPNAAQAPSTNSFTVRVTDNGTPPASSTTTFLVTVGVPPQFAGGSMQISGDQVSFGFGTVPGKKYQAQYKNRLTDATWINLGTAQTATGTTLTISDNFKAQATRYYQVIVVE